MQKSFLIFHYLLRPESHIIAGNNLNFPQGLPTKVADFLLKVRTIQINHLDLDSLVLSKSPSHKLSFRGAWDLVCLRSDIKQRSHLIWQHLMNRRLSYFSKRILHRRILIKDLAQKIGVNLFSVCSPCNSDGETIYHLCFPPLMLLNISYWLQLLSIQFTLYLWSSLSLGCDKVVKQGMTVVFFSPVYVIWKSTNMSRFEIEQISTPTCFENAFLGSSLIQLWINCECLSLVLILLL